MTTAFQIYAEGILALSMCTNATNEEATAFVNDVRPTGLDTPWSISDDTAFSGGEPHPGACEENPDTHRHLLFEC